jgi:hypothetical protein
MPPPAPAGVSVFHDEPRSGFHHSNRDSNRHTSPSAPSASNRATVRKSPSHRRFWNTVSGTLRSRAFSTSPRPCAEVTVNGLSTTTATPASRKAWASSAWVAGGVPMTTRSSSRSSNTSARATTSVPGYRPSTSARRCSLPVTTAASV